MVKFDIEKKGYDVEQVENYINTLSLKYEEKLAEQKDRVFTMRNELEVLKSRLEVIKTRTNKFPKRYILRLKRRGKLKIALENFTIWK